MTKQEFNEYVKEVQPNICQIVASKEGKMVYNQTWNGYKQEDDVHIASVTKSIISLLIGIAIDQGMIESLDTKVIDFFPEYITKRGEKTIYDVSLYHLMTMTAPYKFKSEPWTKVCTSEDWTKAALDLLGGKSGITGEFKYSTLGIQILSGILSRVSKMTTLNFANQYLFEPLGIKARKSYFVNNKEEHIQFATDKSPKENDWFCDPKGIAATGFGLCLSAQDMLKIGQLCLNKGIYNGKSIVSSEWVKQMITPRIQCNEHFNYMQYGYLWWIIDEEKEIFAAIGDGGNVIYSNASKKIVVAVTATFKPLVLDRVQFIQEYIEPLL